MSNEEIVSRINQVLSSIQEPDLKGSFKELDIVEILTQEKGFLVKVGVHNPAMHARKKLEGDILTRLKEQLPETEVQVETVPLPPESKRPPHLRTVLRNVQHIVAVASGKGGVGKSTVTANLAVALKRKGFSVGIVDADIYGPSMPIMFGVEDSRPGTITIDGVQKLTPVESQGIKLLSIGFFADMSQPIVWRGPMAVKALKQMFTDADWGELDYLLVDLPPGTGDVHLSLVQDFPLGGAIVVSTPQLVALSDASRAVAMFRLPSVNVPVLGMVENMAYFTPAELPQNKYYIFGQGGARKMAAEVQTPFLGEIPLIQEIREAGDAGKPAAIHADGPAASAFDAIATSVIKFSKLKAGQPV